MGGEITKTGERDMADETERYNGWKNYETWVVNLGLGKEEPSRRHWAERAEHWAGEPSTSERWSPAEAELRGLGLRPVRSAKFNLADELKAAVEDGCPIDSGLYRDLIGAALSEVDWHEIAGGMLGGVAISTDD